MPIVNYDGDEFPMNAVLLSHVVLTVCRSQTVKREYEDGLEQHLCDALGKVSVRNVDGFPYKTNLSIMIMIFSI